DAFNKVAAKTGISARVNEKGDGITLVNDNGEDIVFANQSAPGNDIKMQLTGGATIAGTTTLTAASGNEVGKTGTGSIRVTGQVTFDSHMSFSVTDSNAVADNVTAGGFIISTDGDTPIGGQLQTMQNADVATVESSYRTISLVDAALDTINAQRAAYGALQSRFENTITNLQVSSENMSAARSRIRDTDFAEETAELTRAQILQQAGTAMLSQANALPQQVLQLLQ
ncbi:MAG: flagellin, partial [Rhodocyclaceae bacterium]|nr:flagellin [Rhodocyclaceae bacterium]